MLREKEREEKRVSERVRAVKRWGVVVYNRYVELLLAIPTASTPYLTVIGTILIQPSVHLLESSYHLSLTSDTFIETHKVAE